MPQTMFSMSPLHCQISSLRLVPAPSCAVLLIHLATRPLLYLLDPSIPPQPPAHSAYLLDPSLRPHDSTRLARKTR